MFTRNVEDIVIIRTMGTRQKAISKKVVKYQKELTAVKIKAEDYTVPILAADAAELDVCELIAKCNQKVDQLLQKNQPPPAVVNADAGLVKMTATPFPEFDGTEDIEMWET